MNNLGRSNNDTHQGDTLATQDLEVSGDLTVDGTLTFATIAGATVKTDKLQTLTAGGDMPICDAAAIKAMSILNTGIVQLGQAGTEYKMPVADGTVGQILSTNGAGQVSFTAASVGEARVVQNKFMTNTHRNTFTAATYQSIQSTGSGSLSIADATEFPTNGSYRIVAHGNWTVDSTGAALAFGKFRVKFGTLVYETDSLLVSGISQIRTNTGVFEIVCIVTNIGSGFLSVEFNGIYSVIGTTSDQPTFAMSFTAPNKTPVGIAVPAYPIVVAVEWQDNSSGGGTCYPQATNYYVDYLNVTTSILATSTPGGTTDHLALTNLNGGVGDGGHDRMVLDIGRAGGQDMHGGTAAGENLTFDSTTDAAKGSIIMYSDLVMSSKDVTTIANLDTSGVISQSANSAVNVDFTAANTLQLNSDSLIEIKGTNVVRLNVGSTNKLTVGLTAIVLDEDTQLVNSELKLVGVSSINMNGNGITSLLDPVLAQDAATKNYVDTMSGSLQFASSLITTVDSTAVTIPNDATVPQITEGKEYTSLAFTPVSASSTLLITVQMNVSNTGTSMISCPLFVDATAAAISSGVQQNFSANYMCQVNYTYIVASASLTARTYRVRFGAGSGTTLVNRNTAQNPFQGGVLRSGITVQEIA